MSSKNNPENRGKVTELRRWEGKKVKPVLVILPGVGRYMAAQDEGGNLIINKSTKQPVKYSDCEEAA